MKTSSSPALEKQRARSPFLLPVRRTRWQALRAWLRQLWQRWHTPQIEVQPPLAPARHKPFPNRPHHRRRQAVFAALATAPPDATIHELIAHVRAVTGLGCSPKLIAAWKREHRPEEGEKRRTREGENGKTGEGERKWAALQMRLFLFFLVCGCAWSISHLSPKVGAQEITISPAPSATLELQPRSAPATTPRLLRIKLTLQSTQELRVKAGDSVNAGDVISDHHATRQRLLVQKRALQTAAQHLHTQMQLTAESLRQLQSLGLELPPTTFAAEQAAIQRAETEALAIHRTVEIQRQKLVVVGGQWPVAGKENFPSTEAAPTTVLSTPLPTTDHRSVITEHEEAKLTQAQDKQLLAHADIELHKAKLTTAREVRSWEEQKHRVEITRQYLSVRSQQQQAEIEQARLTAQIAELDLQLAQLTEVRAPFAGTIKRIEWEEMQDEKLTVLVYLSIGSR